MRKITDFLFETMALKRLQRTGWQILGGGNAESIAEHSFMVAVISYILARRLKADTNKTLITALFHDFAEGRTGDVYKLADLYVKVDEKKARGDAFSVFCEIKELLDEYEERKSLESRIVHDADNLALMLELKQLIENGNINAKEWFEVNMERLRLPQAKKLAGEIKKSNSQGWWKKERQMIHKGYKK